MIFSIFAIRIYHHNRKFHKGTNRLSTIKIVMNNVYFKHANEMVHLKDFRGAIAEYSKAIEIDPKHKDAYNNRGFAKSNLLDFSGSVADYTMAIEIDPKYAEAYNNRGLAKMKLDQKDSGCLDLKKARELGYEDAYEAIKKYCK